MTGQHKTVIYECSVWRRHGADISAHALWSVKPSMDNDMVMI